MDINDFIEDKNELLDTTQSTELSVMVNQIATLEKIVAEAKQQEKQLKELKEQLKQSMEKNNVKKWETPSGIKCSLVEDTPPSVEEYKRFNEGKFREEHKDIWMDYLEDVKEEKPGKKGYVRVTLPKEL